MLLKLQGQGETRLISSGPLQLVGIGASGRRHHERHAAVLTTDRVPMDQSSLLSWNRSERQIGTIW